MNTSRDRDRWALRAMERSETEPRLYHAQRIQLEVRRAYMRRVLAEDGAGLDPVLRAHLGLGPAEEDGDR